MSTDITIGPSDQLMAALNTLAEKIGVTTETIFPWYIQHQYIVGVASLIIGIILLTLGIFLVRKSYKKVDFEAEVADSYMIMFFIGIVALFFTTAFILLQGSTILSQLFIPEYNATQTLLEDLSKLTGNQKP